MKKLLLLLVGLLIVSTMFAQKSNRIEIPFTMDRNLIIIQAKIAKNEAKNFIFDTGTEGIMLLDSIANDYKMAGVDSIMTPNGEFAGTMEMVMLPKISFEGLTLTKRKAIKMPRQMLFSNRAVGIIGMQTFVGYMITLDYKKSKIILDKGSLTANSKAVPINIDHLLEGKIKLNNKEVLAHFDCGGAGYISIPKRWNSVYILKSEPVFLTKGKTPMGDFDVFKSELDGNIQIGNYVLENPKVNLVTGDFFYSVNFGYGFFREHLITIDTKNKLMLIEQV
jgi:hypothetical protein